METPNQVVLYVASIHAAFTWFVRRRSNDDAELETRSGGRPRPTHQPCDDVQQCNGIVFSLHRHHRESAGSVVAAAARAVAVRVEWTASTDSTAVSDNRQNDSEWMVPGFPVHPRRPLPVDVRWHAGSAVQLRHRPRRYHNRGQL